MANDRQDIKSGFDAPAFKAYAVTPDDSNDLPAGDARALYIGGDGDVEVITSGDTTVVFKGLKSGSVLPVRVRRVKAASTTILTVGAIVALY